MLTADVIDIINRMIEIHYFTIEMHGKLFTTNLCNLSYDLGDLLNKYQNIPDYSIVTNIKSMYKNEWEIHWKLFYYRKRLESFFYHRNALEIILL